MRRRENERKVPSHEDALDVGIRGADEIAYFESICLLLRKNILSFFRSLFMSTFH